MRRGFTLFDIFFAMLLLTLVGMIAIPGVLDRMRIEDEARAISALQWIAAAQARLRTAPAGEALDRNGDGVTEYGFLADLVRTTPTDRPWGRPPVEGDRDRLELPGFYLAVLLPGPDGEPLRPSEGARVDPGFAARTFAAVAWPIDAGRTGYRAYFVNQELFVYEHANEGGFISGPRLPPLPSPVLATRNPHTGAVVPPPSPAAPWMLFLKREQREVIEKRLGRPVGR